MKRSSERLWPCRQQLAIQNKLTNKNTVCAEGVRKSSINMYMEKM